MDILFIPFLTDTQNAYSRVKICAQSAVFTPCDFAFPPNGIKAESTPNTEMILVADVDLELLK